MGPQSLSIGLLGLKPATYTDKWEYVCLKLIVQTRHASSYNQDTSGEKLRNSDMKNHPHIFYTDKWEYVCLKLIVQTRHASSYNQDTSGEKLRNSDMKNHPACSAGFLFGRANVISSRSLIRSAMFDL